MVVELESTIKQALKEIFDIIQNQQAAELAQMQTKLAGIEREFTTAMIQIQVIQWVAFALAVGAGVYCLVKWVRAAKKWRNE